MLKIAVILYINFYLQVLFRTQSCIPYIWSRSPETDYSERIQQIYQQTTWSK